MNLQINTTPIAYPKSCLNANSGNLQDASDSSLVWLADHHGCIDVVNSIDGLYAVISHEMKLGYVTIDFLPLGMWISNDWQENDIISISIRMKVAGSEREEEYILSDAEDILDAKLTGRGSYAKEVRHA